MNERAKLGLPFRPFLYTIDQVADLLQLPIDQLEKYHVYFDGRSVGIQPRDRMRAQNLSPSGVKPEWRVEEGEFIRYMKAKGIRIMYRSERQR